MVNEYIVTVFLDEQCQIEAQRFRQMGLDSIVKTVEKTTPNWEVIILMELWDNPHSQGNYWTKREITKVA